MKIFAFNTNPFYIRNLSSENIEGTLPFKSRSAVTASFLAPFGADTISFKGRPPVAVYAFNSEGKRWRFDSYAKAADREEGLGLNKRAIGRAANGELRTTGGYAFCNADKIELKDEDGNVLLDKDGKPRLDPKVVEEIMSRFDTENRAVYEITTKKYTWFESPAKAIAELEIGRDGVYDCLKGAIASTAGRTFVYAKDFEKVDENGKVVPDEARLQEMVEIFAGLDRTVYVYNELGDRFTYANPHVAARKLGLNYTGVAACLSGKQKTTGQFVIAFARDLNKKDSLGRTIIDKQKVKELLKNFEHCPVYAIEKDGTTHWFKSQQDAVDKLELNKRSVQLCLQGAYYTTGGYTFARAFDIEKTRKDGSTYVSKRLLKEYLKLFDHKELYAVNKDGEKFWFESPAAASKELEVDLSRISACLLKKRRKTGEWTFIWAQDLEQKLPGGKKRINETVMKNLKKRFRTNEVYAIKRDGTSVEKFDTRQAAAAACEVDQSSVSKNINGFVSSAGGYRFEMAYNLDKKDENGKMVLDMEKLRKVMRSIQKKACYMVAADGSYERYESDYVANRQKDKKMTFNFAMQRYKARNGWCRIPAAKVEDVTEDCKFELHEDKLMEEFERLRKQAVYIVDSNGNAERYNNRLYSRLLTDAFDYDDFGRSCTLKPGYRCIPAEFVETKGRDGKYRLDKGKLNSELAIANEIYTQTTMLYRQNENMPPKAEDYIEVAGITTNPFFAFERNGSSHIQVVDDVKNSFDYLSIPAKLAQE